MAPEFRYPRYLEAKRTVDDRALNRQVLHVLGDGLRGCSHPRVLEVGGGTGSMVRRLADWGVLSAADYTLVDRDAEALAALPEEAPAGISLQAHHADISEFLRETDQEFDFVVAHAVLDLIDLEEFLPLLWSRCAPAANFWFTINFDGESIFLPPRPEDEAIWHAYHASMNRRPGSSHAGRKLFGQLTASGASIAAAGSSDWVVHARDGAYEGDEAYFLEHIIHTVDCELRDAPPLAKSAFEAWVKARYQDVESAQLVYIAHQLDFTGSAP